MLLSIYRIYRLSIFWIKSKLNSSQFILLCAIIVGLVAGFAAVLLKTLVHYFHVLLATDTPGSLQKFYLIAFPMAGILLTTLIIKVFFHGDIGKGISGILYEIAQKASIVRKDKMYSHIITSSLTVGFGGSAGLEAPIVVTGSAIGSNIASGMNLNFNERTILLAAGAAAGIAAVFNAPIAGVIFALEVILADISVSAFIPIILASVTGALVSKIVLQEQILLHFKLQQAFNYNNVPYYIVLGLMCGLLSLYYAKITHKIKGYFDVHKNIYLKALTGGILLGLLFILFPTLFGEGYNSIKQLAEGDYTKVLNNSIFESLKANEWFLLLFIGIIPLIKVIATSITLSSGGNGGNFAPSLFAGAYLGFFFSKLTNILHISNLPISNFTIVGMAGVLSGVMYAPLTGVFLIAEITGGYELILPLMLVSAMTYAIVKHFEPYSMDTKKLAANGKIFTTDRDRNILTLIKTEHLIERDISTIRLGAKLGELAQVIEHSRRSVVGVIEPDGKFAGMITFDDVRKVLFKKELYSSLQVDEFMKAAPEVIHTTDDMVEVMKKFDSCGAWNLPVVENGKLKGFISKSSIFSTYRSQLRRNMKG